MKKKNLLCILVAIVICTAGITAFAVIGNGQKSTDAQTEDNTQSSEETGEHIFHDSTEEILEVIEETLSPEDAEIQNILSDEEYKAELESMIEEEKAEIQSVNTENPVEIETISYMGLLELLYGENVYNDVDTVEKDVVIDGVSHKAYGEYSTYTIVDNTAEQVAEYSSIHMDEEKGTEYFNSTKDGLSFILKASGIESESQCRTYADYVGTYVVHEEGGNGVPNRVYTVSVIYYFAVAK